MIKSKEEILNSINSLVGEETTDEVISIIEDVTDTITDFENRVADSTNWEEKYNENDKMWREKYRERFLSNEVKEEIIDNEGLEENEEAPLTYDALFTEE